jgi:hypothetical protein
MKPFHGYQICPVCGSGEIEYASRRYSSTYTCKECGYHGTFIVEYDGLENVKKMRKYLKTHKNDNVAPAFSLQKEYRWSWWLSLVSILITIAIGIAMWLR